jgi:hypothetical protein
MLNRDVYLSEIERIMDIRAGRGHWCYFTVPVKGGAQVATCDQESDTYHLLDGQLFYFRNQVDAENVAHELNSNRLALTADVSAVIVAKAVALATFKNDRRHK